jgi:ATP-dependent Lhr-like helicase
MRQGAVDIALANLEGTGNVMRGSFTPGADIEEFCDRRILARINRDTIGRLRREIEPVPQATFMRFLLAWQHITPDTMLRDDGGLLDAVEQLQGFEAGAAAWESEILPSRVAGYRSTMLDELCLSGEVTWGRFSRQSTGQDEQVPRSTMTRSGPSRWDSARPCHGDCSPCPATATWPPARRARSWNTYPNTARRSCPTSSPAPAACPPTWRERCCSS